MSGTRPKPFPEKRPAEPTKPEDPSLNGTRITASVGMSGSNPQEHLVNGMKGTNGSGTHTPLISLTATKGADRGVNKATGNGSSVPSPGGSERGDSVSPSKQQDVPYEHIQVCVWCQEISEGSLPRFTAQFSCRSLKKTIFLVPGRVIHFS